MIATISSVREFNIEMQLEAERALLPKIFAFVHSDYNHYLTYQHALLEGHCRWNKDLKENVLDGDG